MVFSDSTGKGGIIEEIDFLLQTDATDYPVAQKTRNCNRWYDRAVTIILQADSKWEWDDLNKTDLPISTTSLVANQQDYSISAAGFLKILKVECKDSAGNWGALRQIDQSQRKDIAMTEYREVAGTPVEFDLFSNSIFLYPKPSYASSGGLKVYFQRTPDYFEADDTDTEPGFAVPYHRLLSYGAALDYCIANNMAGRIPMLQNEISRLEGGLIQHYSSRNKDMKNTITLEKENYGVAEEDIGRESVDW